MTSTESLYLTFYIFVPAAFFIWFTLTVRRFRKAERLLKLLEAETKASLDCIKVGDRIGYHAHNARYWEIDAQLTKLIWK